MEKKKQTRKELEKEIKNLKESNNISNSINDELISQLRFKNLTCMFFIFCTVLFFIFSVYLSSKADFYREENEMLKEQIQTYTITVECTYPDAYSFLKYNVTDYQDYVEELELIKQDKNCEVVE